MTGVTARMAACLQAIRDLTIDGIPPTVAELGEYLSIPSSGTVHRILRCLQARGVIDWRRHEARSLYIIGDRFAPAELEQMSDEALRRTAAHIAGILASRGGGVRGSERVPEHRRAAALSGEGRLT